ncbi:hypothetical protein A33Q_2732 [Indibacter alkaliphilus LW1]|uniref:Uncharacterized protein n=1 Tax=Indibacter alkaliphilus (strain CCUG 57479 / KCTC 22604 / LW1) TaxID=1189612 RepID=S2DB59_INDAL|nr:hypothetical protein A33Q_2732 [Indibacter alkaliphilus LW1]
MLLNYSNDLRNRKKAAFLKVISKILEKQKAWKPPCPLYEFLLF